MGEIVQAVGLDRQRAGGDLVQQRLPQMGARAIDERDACAAAAAELFDLLTAYEEGTVGSARSARPTP